MIAPKFIQNELACINSCYFAVFNPCVQDKKSMSHGNGRWQIRKWKHRTMRMGLWDTDLSEVIFTICREEMTDMGLVDAGYDNIDRRVITAIGKSNYWKADWKRKISAVDWHNEKKERQANAEMEYQSKYVAKRVWRNLHEPTVNQSGRWDYYKG